MNKGIGNVVKYTIVSLVVITLIFLSTAYFLYVTVNDLRQRSYSDLQTITTQKVSIIKARLDGSYETLNNISVYLASEPDCFTNVTETTNVLNSAVGVEKFNTVGLAGLDGDAILSDGRKNVNLSGAEYFEQSISGAESLDAVSGGNASFILSVPVYSGDTVIGVIYGSLSSAEFFEQIVDIEDSGNYLIICDDAGNALVKNQECKSIEIGENLISVLGKGKLSYKVTTENVKEDMAANKTNTVEFKIDGNVKNITYVPFGINGWYVVNVIDGGLFSEENELLWLNAGMLILEIFVIFGCLIWYIISESDKNEKVIENEKHYYEMSESHLRKLEAFSDNVIFESDLVEDTIRFNDNFKNVFGRECDLEKISDCFTENDFICPEDMAALQKAFDGIARGVPHEGEEYRVKNSSGQYIWTRIEAMLLRDKNGIPRKILGKISNIDMQKRAIFILQAKAEKDQLTNLYNHISMKAKVEEYLMNEGKDETHAFMIIDVDNFKHVNDTYGHFEGDQVLISFARQISKTFRSADIVGRLGGDEFAVFVKNIGTRAVCVQKADMLCRSINRITSPDFPDLKVSCSVGITIQINDGVISYNDFYQKADKALYVAKNNGKNGFYIS